MPGPMVVAKWENGELLTVVILSLTEDYTRYFDAAGEYDGRRMVVVGIDKMSLNTIPDALLELTGSLTQGALQHRIEKHYGTGQAYDVTFWLFTLRNDD